MAMPSRCYKKEDERGSPEANFNLWPRSLKNSVACFLNTPVVSTPTGTKL